MSHKELSIQLVFNHVCKHLMTQKARAWSLEKDVCVCYDAVTQRRCAYGCLLPKKAYNNKTVIFQGYVLERVNIDHETYSLMTELQECHDNLKPSRWSQRLRRIARDFCLREPECIQLKGAGDA